MTFGGRLITTLTQRHAWSASWMSSVGLSDTHKPKRGNERKYLPMTVLTYSLYYKVIIGHILGTETNVLFCTCYALQLRTLC